MNETILIHHCCAPCSVEPVEILAGTFDIRSFWFNPNVHPKDENTKRRESLLKFAVMRNLPVYEGNELSPAEWIEKFNASGETDRCKFCYNLRFNETAKTAGKLGITYFTTTLLSSPYQKHDIIKNLGFEIAERQKLKFFYQDFRPFYYKGKNKAREQGFYLQKYCGCEFSLKERIKV